MILLYQGLHSADWSKNAADMLQAAISPGEFEKPGVCSVAGDLQEGRSVKASNDIYRRLRASTKSTTHTVCVILSNTMSKKIMICCNVFAQVPRGVHGPALVQASTPWSCSEYRIRAALGDWQQELEDIVAITCDATRLQQAGFLHPEWWASSLTSLLAFAGLPRGLASLV